MANTTSVISLVRGLIDDKLKINGRNIFEYTGDLNFVLSESFVSSSSIQVFKNGILQTSGYTYNSATNEVIFTSLTLGNIIEIRYSYYAKYSDSEILDAIASALCYFVQYRYNKVFEINNSDDIVAVSGTNPDKRDLQFIAIITAIVLEPNNIKIQTKEFTIIGTETKSKSEQLQEAFSKFTRSLGIIEFLEDNTSVW